MKRSLIDHVEFTVRAGNGGNGSVSFRREKYITKGGPDGGDGGNGGSIYFISNPHMTTLIDYAGKDMFEALPGGRGLGKRMHGKNAHDMTITVPVGTVIWAKKVEAPLDAVQATYDVDDARSVQKAERFATLKQIRRGAFEWEKLADLDQPGMSVLIAKGGKGGNGNEHFKSSINTTPMYAEPGGYGEEKYLKLEMKILADIGLVGLPNAGKSTLLSVLTAAKPEIESYPFTTLSPNLGVMDTLIIADIPGLIEDAHEGKGLGIEFLRHIERCKELVYVISPTDSELEDFSTDLLLKQYEVVRNEVRLYGQGVDDKKRMVVINKIDVLSKEQVKAVVLAFEKLGEKTIAISAATQTGIETLKTAIIDSVQLS
jgi:GTP-binding protein